MLILHGFGLQLRGDPLPVDLALQLGNARFLLRHGLLHGDLRIQLAPLQPAAQLGQLRILLGELQLLARLGLLEGGLTLCPAALQLGPQRRNLLVPFALRLGHGQLHRKALFGRKGRLPLRQLLTELLVPHLLHNRRIARFIHLEYLAALGAFDLLHTQPPVICTV